MGEVFSNVWDALEDTPEDALRMTVLSDLMMQIQRIIRENGWTAAEAAKSFHTTRPRMEELLADRIDRFEIDDLLKMTAALGRRVRVEIEAA